MNEIGYMAGEEYNRAFEEDIKEGLKLPVEKSFYVPVWPRYKNQEVFSTTETISSDKNSDIGALKALYNSRGNKRATYRDLYPQGETYEFGDSRTVNINTEADSVQWFNSTTARSSIMSVMAEFDNLIHGMVTGINKVLSSNGTAEGTADDHLMFARITIDKLDDDTDGWSTANLMINPDVQQTPSIMANGFRLDDGSRDQQRADALVNLFSSRFSSLNPNNGTQLTFAGYYSAIVSENATNGKVYNSIAANQEAMVRSVESQRQEVVGVSDSDELTQMIRYQNAYNASSRYINTINSMLDTLINSMT
ncbi:MAG: hypothetical protein J5966_10890 [Lachnospiraceae bacterium]|nr:hypothetical protein [Lachnospiraceae bacterium]